MAQILSTSCKKDLPCPSSWSLVLVDSYAASNMYLREVKCVNVGP
jgi:hypothetical protein